MGVNPLIMQCCKSRNTIKFCYLACKVLNILQNTTSRNRSNVPPPLPLHLHLPAWLLFFSSSPPSKLWKFPPSPPWRCCLRTVVRPATAESASSPLWRLACGSGWSFWVCDGRRIDGNSEGARRVAGKEDPMGRTGNLYVWRGHFITQNWEWQQKRQADRRRNKINDTVRQTTSDK